MRKVFFCLAAVFLMATMACGPGHSASGAGNAPNSVDALTQGAPFIFKGKVVLLHTNTTGARDVSNAGVVTVSEVIDAPGALSRMSGEQVTVQFRDINAVKMGEERLFFTDPYWLGESIGVREEGSVGKGDRRYRDKAIGSLINQARQRQNDSLLLLKRALDSARPHPAGGRHH